MRGLRFPLDTEHLLVQPQNEENLWNEKWTVKLKEGEQKSIGFLSFEGAKTAGEIPIFVELDPEYRNMGYGSELFYSMARFAFRFRNIREIHAECEHENDLCVHALDKAGYVFRENKDHRDHYSVKRSKPAWAGLYLFVGLLAGLIIGIVVSNLWAGTIVGVLAGLIFGYVLDEKEKKGSA